MAARRVLGAEDDERGTLSADIPDDDLHADLGDLKFALATLPYGDVEELVIALYDNRDAAPTLLDDTLISCQILAAFECALEADDLDIDGLSRIIALCAVLFRIEWSENAEFTRNASRLIIGLLGCERDLLGETWHDALDTLCYAITSDKIADPEVIRCAIVSQYQFLGPEADACFDDRMRSFKFLATMADHPMARFDDAQKQGLMEFAEQLGESQ
jgi:hypothetical protein